MKRKRLDEILLESSLVRNKNEAFVLITEGRILVNGQKAVSPAQVIGPKSKIEIKKLKEYVGRGAYKLEDALSKFKIDVSGKVCADVGSSTGGFTEVLLRHGATKVYAIDTARGKLDSVLRNNPKVIVMEKTDIRSIESLPQKISFFTVDVSLISIRHILPALKKLAKKNAEVVALFKPQYEVGDKFLRHGVVTDVMIRNKVVIDFQQWAEKNKFRINGRIRSPILGREGNVEYLFYLVFDTSKI